MMELDDNENKRKREFSNSNKHTKKKRRSKSKSPITTENVIQYYQSHRKTKKQLDPEDLQSLLKKKKETERQISIFKKEEKIMERQHEKEEKTRILELKKQKGEERIQQEKEQNRIPITEKLNPRQLFQDYIKTIINEDAYANEQGKTCGSTKNVSLKEQAQQEFIKKYINLTVTNYEELNNSVILWHGLGSGKTLSSIFAAIQSLNQKNKEKVNVLLPASLQGNFTNEIDTYISNYIDEKDCKKNCNTNSKTSSKTRKSNSKTSSKTRKNDPFLNIKKQFNKCCLKFNFYTYNGDLNIERKFRTEENLITGDSMHNKFNNSIIIIDESQLFISKTFKEIKSNKNNPSTRIYNFLSTRNNDDRNNIQIILLSGTPIIYDVNELFVLFNILKGEPIFESNDFNQKDGKYNLTKGFKPNTFIYNNVDREADNQIKNDSIQKINEKRKEYCLSILNSLYVNNNQVIKSKIYGLLSFFGNIESMLPKIKLLDNCRIGYNNEGKAFYSIKECFMTEKQKNNIEIIHKILESINAKKQSTIPDEVQEQLIEEQGDETQIAKTKSGQNNYLNIINAYSNTFAYSVENINNNINFNNFVIDKTEKVGIHTYQTKDRIQQIGDLFNLYFKGMKDLIEDIDLQNNIYLNNELKDFSIKMDEIVKCIRENIDKKHLIYCESRRINVTLVRYLSKLLNYKEFKSETEFDTNTYYYMFLTGQQTKKNNNEYINFKEGEGQCREGKERNIKFFNNQDYTSKLNVIIINSASAEGITLKRVNYVHFLEIPPNISRLLQIIGRAVRNCTHVEYENSNLSVEKKEAFYTVTPIVYLAIYDPTNIISLKNEKTKKKDENPEPINSNEKDIIKYKNCINKHETFLPYLQLLKESSIDCFMNKKIKINENLKCYTESFYVPNSPTLPPL